MPSSHSSTVCALCVATYFRFGAGGFEFALAAFFAFIVMYDARGVRRETGLQARVINELVEWVEKMGNANLSADDKLKEFIGHSPFQVLMGAILGVIVGFLCHGYLFS